MTSSHVSAIPISEKFNEEWQKRDLIVGSGGPELSAELDRECGSNSSGRSLHLRHK